MTTLQTLHGHVVTETNILRNHEIQIRDGAIYRIVPGVDSDPVENASLYILPGFRDQHVHDWVGQSLVSSSENNVTDRFQKTMKAFAHHGVTGVYLATFGAPLESLESYCRSAREWMDHPRNGVAGAKLLGVHIEGTFINDECRGAQPAEYCLIPTRDDCIQALNRLNETGAVKLANIVPDYGDASMQCIRHASELGWLVGSGHTKTSAEQLRQAFDGEGLKFMVHFTNGPTGQSFKPFGGGGAFEGGMNVAIHKELILDRIHIDERYVLDMMRRTEERWGLEKIVVVTDALIPDVDEIPSGEFSIGSTLALLDPTRRFLSTTAYIQQDGSTRPAPPNTLCGSVLSMDRAFSNLITLFTHPISGHWYDHSPLSLDQAICKAARLCSTHQSRLDGSYSKTGSIAEGKKADLVAGTIHQNETGYEFQVRHVLVEGNPVSIES